MDNQNREVRLFVRKRLGFMGKSKQQKKKNVQEIVASGAKSQRRVLVATYKKQPDQLGWIRKRRLYNYPLSEEEADATTVDDWSNVKELWLYSGTKDRRHIYAAEFGGIKSRKDFLAEHPDYPKGKGKGHGDNYAVFLVRHKYQPTLDESVVVVRTADFKRTPKVAKAVRAYQAGGELGCLLDYLPAELAPLTHDQLRVCEAAIQYDFFDELLPAVTRSLTGTGAKFRLATVFSGIGAIEQALIRTHVDHEIVFACDNGDQTPFVCGAVAWQECVGEFRKLSKFVDGMQPSTESQCWAAEIIRQQRDTIQLLLNGAPAMSKRPERELKDRVQMLFEAVGFYKFRCAWESERDWKARKNLVDMLYRPLLSRNKVRQSYMANYPVTDDRFHWNVTFLEGEPYRDQVDLFVGGSPCQSFSLVGKQMGLSDTRGTLFYEYARLVSEIRPKCFIYENVRALLSNDGGKTWATMAKVFTDLGYDWKYKVLNSKDYGIPQNRERVFVVGFRKDLGVGDKFEFPLPMELKTTMQDYLLDVVPGKYYLPEKGVRFVLDEGNLTKRYTQVDGSVQLCQKKNQQFNWHGDFVFVDEETAERLGMPEMAKYYLSEKVTKYVLASGTKTFYSRPQTDLSIARPLLTSMHKMHRAGVDNYITRQGRIRKLAPRECLRLMGFSDTFRIVVPDTPMYQQAGNAIVVDVLVSILDSIKHVVPELFEKKKGTTK